MKNYIIKVLLTCTIIFFNANASLAKNNEIANSENQSPEKLNGIIKKMILVASDVFTVRNDEYEKSFQVAQNSADQDGGLVGTYFENRKGKNRNTLDDTVNPLYWEKVRENYLKKKKELEEQLQEVAEEEEEKELSIKDDKDTKIVESNDGIEIILKRRPEENYRKNVLPDTISKKVYTSENSHLPIAVYEEEYKDILVQSILRQDIDVMRAIIQRLGTTEIRDRHGNTPLLYAVISGNIVPIKVLIGMGAGINIQNNQGITPIYVAIKDRNFELAKHLINKGVSTDVSTKNGKTLLMVAAENNDAKVINMLLDMGHDVNKKMNDGNTALHFAAMRNSSLVADILITKGAKSDVINHNGYTPIMIASAYGSQETVNLLINSGADLRTTDAHGQNAYLLARNNNHMHIASLIATYSSSRMISPISPQISPIDKSLPQAPIPLKKPEETPQAFNQDVENIILPKEPTAEINDNVQQETIEEFPAHENDSTEPYEMPLPVFTKEEMDQM
jgi:ankyrin repeat protein